MNWLFVGVMIFVFGMGVYGYNRGILRMLYSVVTLIISIVAMYFVSPFVADALKSNEVIMGKIEAPIQNTVNDKIEDGVNVQEILQDYYHLPQNVSSKISDMVRAQNSTETVVQSMSRTIADYICGLIAYISVFFVLRVVCVFLGRGIHIFERIPIIGTVNRIGGATLALIEALVCIWIFMTIVSMLNYTPAGHSLMQMIWNSEFLGNLYQDNPIVKFMVNCKS